MIRKEPPFEFGMSAPLDRLKPIRYHRRYFSKSN
jgi:hypothetical protein